MYIHRLLSNGVLLIMTISYHDCVCINSEIIEECCRLSDDIYKLRCHFIESYRLEI